MNSALSYWELTDELPDRVHLAVPRGAHQPIIEMPATVVHQFAAATFDVGRIRVLTEANEPFWIYTPERSVVDAMRLQHLVGRDVALQALARYLRRPDACPLDLIAVARQIGGAGRIREALEVALA